MSTTMTFLKIKLGLVLVPLEKSLFGSEINTRDICKTMANENNII